jgi:Protein of unknown function (DUF4236)
MGFRYRKSFGSGPFRMTVSKRGVSYSLGTKGARLTKRADGRVSSTLRVPGTGLSYICTAGKGRRSTRKTSASSYPVVALFGYMFALVLIVMAGAVVVALYLATMLVLLTTTGLLAILPATRAQSRRVYAVVGQINTRLFKDWRNSAQSQPRTDEPAEDAAPGADRIEPSYEGV